MIKLIQDEILSGIKRRGITDRFNRFQSTRSGKSTLRQAGIPARSWRAIAG